MYEGTTDRPSPIIPALTPKARIVEHTYLPTSIPYSYFLPSLLSYFPTSSLPCMHTSLPT